MTASYQNKVITSTVGCNVRQAGRASPGGDDDPPTYKRWREREDMRRDVDRVDFHQKGAGNRSINHRGHCKIMCPGFRHDESKKLCIHVDQLRWFGSFLMLSLMICPVTAKVFFKPCDLLSDLNSTLRCSALWLIILLLGQRRAQ